jgi:alpha-amylase/alpha-mannosidase (GH57 family)
MSKRLRRGDSTTLYLNLIWHQHQPLYVDPVTDQLQAPWVRTHGTKDYFSMVALLREYPAVHCTLNLTPVLLYQLQEYYVARLQPFVDTRKGRFSKDYLRTHSDRMDPWFALMLKDAGLFDGGDRKLLLENLGNAFAVNEVTLNRFPDFQLLREKLRSEPQSLSTEDLRQIKFFSFFVHFDPEFLNTEVRLSDGSTIDVTKYVKRGADGTYRLRKRISEADCEYVVVAAVKLLAEIVRIHKQLAYNQSTQTGQIEISTTPFYHPILPLVLDSSVAATCQPNAVLPDPYRAPSDAELQIKCAVEYFIELFGIRPRGMWPAEGGISQEIFPLMSKHGFRWTATDEAILALSTPSGLSKYRPSVVTSDGRKKSVAIFFRDRELSDKVGFVYKDYSPHTAAQDFIETLLKHRPRKGEGDRILTVLLDGENAWEWYRYDPEGRGFLRDVYRRLSDLYIDRSVVTVTPTEYLQGNPLRGVPSHPLRSLPVVQSLWPGSWINANFDTWIGTPPKNRGWEALKKVRDALEKSGISSPRSFTRHYKAQSKRWFAQKAWEHLLAAEGSDWFWWMGNDRRQSGGRGSMHDIFIRHLESALQFAKGAGAEIVPVDVRSLLRQRETDEGISGAMKQSVASSVTVRFQCDARAVTVPHAIYIVGNHPALGDWVPNKVKMYDDGTLGDHQQGDGVWTIEVTLPAGFDIRYKFTNSGREGSWDVGDELPGRSRTFRLDAKEGSIVELLDVFGKL